MNIAHNWGSIQIMFNNWGVDQTFEGVLTHGGSWGKSFAVAWIGESCAVYSFEIIPVTGKSPLPPATNNTMVPCGISQCCPS